jgi:hypothetical protein
VTLTPLSHWRQEVVAGIGSQAVMTESLGAASIIGGGGRGGAVDGPGVGDVTDGHEDRGVVETFRVCGSMEEGYAICRRLRVNPPHLSR